MDKVQKYNSFNTNTPSSESYRNYQNISCTFHSIKIALHLSQLHTNHIVHGDTVGSTLAMGKHAYHLWHYQWDVCHHLQTSAF